MALTRSQLMRIKENRKYWREREANQREAYIRTEDAELAEINRIYADMYRWAEREVNAFYGKYADAEGIDITEAKRRVSQLDIAEYEKLAKEYVKDRDFSDRANQEMRLYNATMKINRLELLKAQIGLKLVDGINDIDKHWEKIATERATQEIIRQSGILGKTLTDTETARTAKQVVNADFYNATFSERIWSHMDNLKSDIAIELQKGFIAGVSSREMARRLKEHAFNKSEKDAFRLARTELRRIQTDVAKDNYERNGITQYEYLAVNPSACPICKELDGRIFDVARMKAGLNAPPIHPNCHCTTAPHIDDSDYEQWLTWLENGGTTAQWDTMTDRQRNSWYDKIVGNLPITEPPKADEFKIATTTAEAEAFADQYGIKADYSKYNIDVANVVNKTIKTIADEFGRDALKKLKTVGTFPKGYSTKWKGVYNNEKEVLWLRNVAPKNAFEKMEAIAKEQYQIGYWSTPSPAHVIRHELGHAIDFSLRDKYDVSVVNAYRQEIRTEIMRSRGKKHPEDYLSEYGLSKTSEFIAESIAEYLNGNPRETAKEVVRLLKGGTR